jgi:phage-related minor tail protein
MSCDYLILVELVIHYNDVTGKMLSIYTNRSMEKGYINGITDYDSDDDQETQYKKYIAEIKKQIEKNTYNKALFINNKWIKESYRKKYEEQLKNEFKDIHEFRKIYKKVSAWERE